MKSPLFQECAQPARTVSLHELVAQFLAKNPPKSNSDRNNVIAAFGMLLEQFPKADTANFTANQLLIFRNNLALRVSKKPGKSTRSSIATSYWDSSRPCLSGEQCQTRGYCSKAT